MFRRCSAVLSASPAVPLALVFGDASGARGSKGITEGMCKVRDIIGLNGHVNTIRNSGLGDRVAAGDLLSLVDICAARCASKHIYGRFTMGFEQQATNAAAALDEHLSDRKSVVTVSMDNILFKHPVMVGDKIDLVGTVVDAGNSSVAVNVDVRRVQFGSNELLSVANAKVFMVAVDSKLRPAKVVPAIRIDAADTASQRQHADAVESKANLKRVRDFVKEMSSLSREEILQRFPKVYDRDATKKNFATIESTQHTVHRLFSPSDLNLNNTVFGGELLRWMEAHAVHCGRMFALNRNIFSIGMHAVEFQEPVYKSDWMRLEAHVVYVRRTTMEVTVQVTAERQGNIVCTNKANFVLASLDDSGHPLAVPTGLDMAAASDEWLRHHVMAEQRYQWMLQSGRVTPTSPR